jgi:phosphopantetheinyl transferase
MSAIFSDIVTSFPLVVEHVTQSEFEVAGLKDWLTDEEQARYQQLQASAVEKRSSQWLLGRYAAKIACCRWLEQQSMPVPGWRNMQIGNNQSGMPFITIQGIEEAPTISIAHSGNEAVAAVAAPGNPIGVDIESRSPRTNLQALAKRICSETEFNHWFAPIEDGELAERFLILWLIKEAVAKCCGKGLQWRPELFAVVKLDKKTAEVVHDDKGYAVNISRTSDGMAAMAMLKV